MSEPRSRNVPPAVARARARVAALTLRRAAPDVIGAARADLEAAKARAAADARALELARLPVPDRMRYAALILAGGGDGTP